MRVRSVGSAPSASDVYTPEELEALALEASPRELLELQGFTPSASVCDAFNLSRNKLNSWVAQGFVSATFCNGCNWFSPEQMEIVAFYANALAVVRDFRSSSFSAVAVAAVEDLPPAVVLHSRFVDMLGAPEETVRSWRNRGFFPCYHVGYNYYVPLSQVDRCRSYLRSLSILSGRGSYVRPSDVVVPPGSSSLAELESLFGVSSLTLSRWCRSGWIPYIKRSGRLFVLPADVPVVKRLVQSFHKYGRSCYSLPGYVPLVVLCGQYDCPVKTAQYWLHMGKLDSLVCSRVTFIPLSEVDKFRDFVAAYYNRQQPPPGWVRLSAFSKEKGISRGFIRRLEENGCVTVERFGSSSFAVLSPSAQDFILWRYSFSSCDEFEKDGYFDVCDFMRQNGFPISAFRRYYDREKLPGFRAGHKIWMPVEHREAVLCDFSAWWLVYGKRKSLPGGRSVRSYSLQGAGSAASICSAG